MKPPSWSEPFRDFGAHPAAQESEHGGRVAIVDEPEGLGSSNERPITSKSEGEFTVFLFPDRGMWFAGPAESSLPRRPPEAVILS